MPLGLVFSITEPHLHLTHTHLLEAMAMGDGCLTGRGRGSLSLTLCVSHCVNSAQGLGVWRLLGVPRDLRGVGWHSSARLAVRAAGGPPPGHQASRRPSPPQSLPVLLWEGGVHCLTPGMQVSCWHRAEPMLLAPLEADLPLCLAAAGV